VIKALPGVLTFLTASEKFRCKAGPSPFRSQDNAVLFESEWFWGRTAELDLSGDPELRFDESIWPLRA
jgi:hypothetical protein